MSIAKTLAIRGATLVGVLFAVLVMVVVTLGATGFSDRMLTAIVNEEVRGLRQGLALTIRDADQLEAALRDHRQELEASHGLDRAWYLRLPQMIGRVIRLDLGEARTLKTAEGSSSITALIRERLPRTMMLVTTASFITAVFGLFFGVKLATRVGSRSDRVASLFAATSNALPAWWAGILLILLTYVILSTFGVRVFPPGGMYSAPPAGGWSVPPVGPHVACLPARHHYRAHLRGVVDVRGAHHGDEHGAGGLRDGGAGQGPARGSGDAEPHPASGRAAYPDGPHPGAGILRGRRNTHGDRIQLARHGPSLLRRHPLGRRVRGCGAHIHVHAHLRHRQVHAGGAVHSGGPAGAIHMKDLLRTSLSELLTSITGKVGVAFLSVMVLISIYALTTNPVDFGDRLWNNPAAWADNPKNVPPAWSGLFEGSRRVTHTVLEATAPSETRQTSRAIERVYAFDLEFPYDEAPSFTSFSLEGVTYYDRPPSVSVSVTRPDGKSLSLYRLVVPAPRDGESAPIRRYEHTPFRVHLTGEPSVASEVSRFLQNELGVSEQAGSLTGRVEEAVFGLPDAQVEGGFRPLKGDYRIAVTVRSPDERDAIGRVRFVVGGSQFGLMGTDSLGRDLARGLVFGFPVALTIGLLTAIMATVIGTTLGIISGYTGGKTDISIQRFSDVLSNIPLLPILLFLAFILGQKLWIVIAILILFGWPGMTIVIRSMVLQIRSGQLVEASAALGASRVAHHAQAHLPADGAIRLSHR